MGAVEPHLTVDVVASHLAFDFHMILKEGGDDFRWFDTFDDEYGMGSINNINQTTVAKGVIAVHNKVYVSVQRHESADL